MPHKLGTMVTRVEFHYQLLAAIYSTVGRQKYAKSVPHFSLVTKQNEK